MGDVRRDKDWTCLEVSLLSLSLGGAPWGAGDGACCDAPFRCQEREPKKERPGERAEDSGASACVAGGAGGGAGAHARAVTAVPAADGFPGNVRPWALGVRCCVLEGNRWLGPRAVAIACFSLQVCSNLKQLGMSGCGGGAKGATALAASLGHWPQLTRLEFSGNHAGNSGCKVCFWC